jgi:hypothetical protein
MDRCPRCAGVAAARRGRYAASFFGFTTGADVAVDTPGALDLKNFERHQAKLRLMYDF